MATKLQPYDQVRQSCKEFLSLSDLPVTLDLEKAKEFAQSLDASAVKAFGVSLATDANFTGTTLKFESDIAEMAFIILLHALDFGSGWRQELHAAFGRGAWLTIKPGIEQLYLHLKSSLESDSLLAVTPSDIDECFQFGKRQEFDDLVQLFLTVIHEIGAQTKEYGSLEAFVEKYHPVFQKSETPAGDWVRLLVDTFPQTFIDTYEIRGKTVHLFKKAQLVVGEIFHRFEYNWKDGNSLTAYVDNVIVATMRLTGVVHVDPELENRIQNKTDIEPGSLEEVNLRAAALCGVEAVLKDGLSSNELGNWLWGFYGKQGPNRSFARHSSKTIFY